MPNALFLPPGARFLASSFPQPQKANGTNAPVDILAFDAAATETAFWRWVAFGYTSGNITCEIEWYSAAATSGVVRWEVGVAAITPETDSTDQETKSFATVHTVDDTHLGTTAKRAMLASVAISNLDSLTTNDTVYLKVSRLGAHANDTLAGDCLLTEVRFTYS